MQFIVKAKASMLTYQYDNVTNIAYNGSTHVVTISYGESGTASFNAENYLIYLTKITIGG